MSGLDIFFGDPIYDDQHRVVRRDFGVKNVIAIAITLYVGNLLMGQMKPKSGQRKMEGGQKGGWGLSDKTWDVVKVCGIVIVAALLLFSLLRMIAKTMPPQKWWRSPGLGGHGPPT